MSKFILIPTKLEAKYVGTRENVVVSGMGKKTLHTLQKLLSEHKLEHLVLAGFAGNLRGEKKTGDILSVTSVTDKKDTITIEPFHPFDKTASMVTVNKPVFTRTVKDKLAHYADIVDMEGYYFAKFCSDNKIKFNIVRIISDNCDIDFTQLSAQFYVYQRALVNIVAVIEEQLF